MKKLEFWLSCLCGAVLGTVLSFASVACVISAFGLEAGSMWRIAMICVLFSIAGAVCFRLKWGGAVLLGCLALLTGFLWREGDAVAQTIGTVEQISKVYDKAYHWGYLELSGGTSGAFYPAAAVAVLIALTVSRTVSRGKSGWMAVTVTLLPLFSCLVVTDTVPHETYLFLLLLGLGVLILTGSVRRRSAEQGNTLTALVTVPVLFTLVILFLMNPRESYVNRAGDLQQNALQWLQQIPERLSEVPKLLEEMTDGQTLELPDDQKYSVDLRDAGPQAEQTYEVMDVFGTVRGTLYLRGQDFDLYSGTGWTSSARQTEDFPGDPSQLYSTDAVTIETRRLRDVLYLPYYPVDTVELMGGRASNTEGVKRYVVTVGVLPAGWENRTVLPNGTNLTLVQQRLDEQAKELYLGLPEDTREQAQSILNRITSQNQSRTEMAKTIASYVRNSAKYDLNTEKMPRGEDDFALWFLEDSETGYCVHFASATAVLLRAAGIPARYVTGYMTQVTPGRTVTVTAAQAHAWVEYYEPVLDAWIVLEATPSAGNDQQTAPDTQPDATETTPILEATEPEQTETAEPTESTPEDPGEEPGEPKKEPSFPGWLKDLIGWMLTAAGLITAVLGQRKLRLELKRQRLSEGEPNPLALKRWREAVLLARLLGQKRPPRAMERLAQKAKYSQHTLTEDELAQLWQYLEESRAELRDRPWYRQVLYQYVYVIY